MWHLTAYFLLFFSGGIRMGLLRRKKVIELCNHFYDRPMEVVLV